MTNCCKCDSFIIRSQKFYRCSDYFSEAAHLRSISDEIQSITKVFVPQLCFSQLIDQKGVISIIPAHINNSNTEQSVDDHCRETACYASSEGKTLSLENTMMSAGLLHDIGKNTLIFDSYIRNAHQGKTISQKPNHSSAGAKYIMEKTDTVNANALLTKQLIAYAVMSHHGLNDCLTYDGTDKFSARLFPDENEYTEAEKNSRGFLEECNIRGVFEAACNEIREIDEKIASLAARINTSKPIQEKSYLRGCLARIILSMLMDADRRNTAEFMNGKIDHRPDTYKRTDYFTLCLDKLNAMLASLSAKADRNRIDVLRQEMSDQCYQFAENSGNGIYKLPIPTGGGKTFSAMRFALRLAQKEKKDRIIYTAPFLSILEQNAAELKGVFGDSENILEHHSNVITENGSEGDRLESYELLSDNWSSPIILTTMVRFLDVLFGKSTTDIRRMHQLKNSIIIIDEAQSIPVRYINMFNSMMNFLGYICKATIVLCTATQPIFEKTDRPLLYADNACMISDTDKYSKAFKRVDIITDHLKRIYDTEDLAQLILSLSGNSSLVILNTKSAVQKLYEHIKAVFSEKYKIVQLTTYMCPQHRLDVISGLKEALARNDKIICISTQLIEAGVDISFETVFRSMSGLDSIAQAAGRCNRHGRNRNPGKTYIIQYKEENVSSLEDIREGQRAMSTMLANFHGEDLLTPEAITAYYEQYFFNRKDIMDAPAQRYKNDFSSEQSLYSFLGSNLTAKREYQKYEGQKYRYPLSQAFKTAAELFSPIEQENSVSIIVYYKDSKEIIESLYSENDTERKKKLLRRLQRYSVNMMISSAKYRRLTEQSAIETQLFEGRLLILTESYYNAESGIDTQFQSLII